MGKIEINEENYNDYQAFLDAKNCISPTNHPMILGIIMSIGACTVVFGGVVGIVSIMMSIMKIAEVIGMPSIIEALTAMMGIGGYIGALVFVGVKVFPKALSKYFLKKFQKKHPNFDISLSKENIEKELEKYRQLSKVPKDIEEKKEEHLDNYKNSFNTMTTEEKLSFLEQEKKFWEQVKVQEKYQDDLEEISKEPESVGRENISIKPKEKLIQYNKEC